MTLFVLPLVDKAVAQDLRLANVPVVAWNASASFDVTSLFTAMITAISGAVALKPLNTPLKLVAVVAVSQTV